MGRSSTRLHAPRPPTSRMTRSSTRRPILEFNPTSARSYQAMSQAYQRKMDTMNAIAMLEKAVALDPMNMQFQNPAQSAEEPERRARGRSGRRRRPRPGRRRCPGRRRQGGGQGQGGQGGGQGQGALKAGGQGGAQGQGTRTAGTVGKFTIYN
jgi:hypothetical protein